MSKISKTEYKQVQITEDNFSGERSQWNAMFCFWQCFDLALASSLP